MEKTKILQDIQNILRDVLDDAGINLTESTVAAEVDGWDSLTHIHLVVALEKHFGIKFSSKEILSWKNVGEMIDSIRSKSIRND
jgi:acyl carrier protein